MKKIKLNPLELDKKTISKLDEKQLKEVIGGQAASSDFLSGSCGGSSKCFFTSGSCAAGSSKC